MDNTLRIGVITNTHGIRGEVKVFPTTDDPKRFKKCKDVILRTKQGDLELTVESCKFFKNLVILKFKEFNNINDVEKFRKCDILVTRENAVPLEEGEYFICDIIGATVQTQEGTVIGKLTDVLQTGANDVYIVEDENAKEILLPVIPDCVKKVDVDNKLITVKIMDGLIE